MKNQTMWILGMAAALVGLVFYFENKSTAPSSQPAAQPGTLAQGSVYQVSIPIVGSASAAQVTAQVVMPNGPLWQNTSYTVSGNFVVARGTYVGPPGVAWDPNSGLTKVG